MFGGKVSRQIAFEEDAQYCTVPLREQGCGKVQAVRGGASLWVGPE